jgi:hypothetical protein
MAQYDFGTIDPNTKSGTALASDLNSWRNAVHSTHGGSSAPSYIVAGMLWVDTTSANYELKLYDGAQSIPVAIIDATNNVARVAVDSAETSYITSTTAAQIRHVIASTDIFTTRATGIQFNIASPVIADSNNNELISFTTTASAVNQIGIANAATGGAATISTVGGDTNINLALTPKGTGGVGVGIASPAGKLHVFASSAGDQFISSSNSAMRLVSTGGANYIQSGTATTSSSAAPLIFTNVGGSGETMRIDASGNLGLGVTPSAWSSAVKVAQVSNASIAGQSNQALFSNNAFFDGAGWKYISSSPASQYYLDSNAQHQWLTAPSGTAGNAITFTQAMTLDASGNVGIGTSSASARLQAHNTINTVYSSSNTLTSGAIAYIRNDSSTNATAATLRLDALGSANVAATSISAVHTGDGASALTLGTRANASSDVTERLRIASAGQIGIGGANYGTSGQVLTSGGSGAAPSWATPAAPTTAQVGTATAGLAAGDVGSYAFLVLALDTDTDYTAGNTFAGSNLRYAGASATTSGSSPVIPSSGTPSGTWRNMGYLQNISSSGGAGAQRQGSTVFLRIS